MEMVVSDKEQDELGDKIDGFAARFKLWLVIPLVISGLVAFQNPSAGFGMILFFIAVWFFLWAIGIILNVFGSLLPESLSEDQSKAFREAGGATLFLGGCAIIGIVLRGDNIVSNWFQEKTPNGMSFGFIDPTFAVLVLLCIWIYTGYRIYR